MADWPRQHECDEFYGNPRGRYGSHASPSWVKKNIIYIPAPFPMNMGGTAIKKIPIHKKCAESLHRVLAALQERYRKKSLLDGEPRPGDWLARMHRDGVTEYDGSFVYRSMRDGGHLSMHAYGAAIDIDAVHNAFRSHDHRFKEGSPIVECFDDEGWIWGGRWRHSPDAMHFQAAIV